MKNIITDALKFNNINYVEEGDHSITIIHREGVSEKVVFVDTNSETVAYLKYYGKIRTVCKLVSYNEAVKEILNTLTNLRGF